MGRILIIGLILQPLLIAVVCAVVVVSPLLFLAWLISFFVGVKKHKATKEKSLVPQASASKRRFEKMIADFSVN
jgi:hypothetical protein